MNLCPACNTGELTAHTEQMPTEWEGRMSEVTLHFSTCDDCGSEIVDQAQSAINKANILEFRANG